MLPQYFKPGVLRNPTFPSSLTWNTTQYSSVEKGAFFERVMYEKKSQSLQDFRVVLVFCFWFYQLFWTQACPNGMGTNRTHRSHARCHPYPIPQPVKRGWPHHWGLRRLLFSNIGVGSFTRPTHEQISESAVFRPYPRRLESLTICRCHDKGNTFFSVIYRS